MVSVVVVVPFRPVSSRLVPSSSSSSTSSSSSSSLLSSRLRSSWLGSSSWSWSWSSWSWSCRPDSVPSQSDAARDRSGCSLALVRPLPSTHHDHHAPLLLPLLFRATPPSLLSLSTCPTFLPPFPLSLDFPLSLRLPTFSLPLDFPPPFPLLSFLPVSSSSSVPRLRNSLALLLFTRTRVYVFVRARTVPFVRFVSIRNRCLLFSPDPVPPSGPRSKETIKGARGQARERGSPR